MVQKNSTEIFIITEPTDECRSREWSGGGFINWLLINRQSDVTMRKPVERSPELHDKNIQIEFEQFKIYYR